MGKTIIGSNALSKAFAGTSQIKKIYYGTTLIYQSAQSLPTPNLYHSYDTTFRINNKSSFPSGTRFNIYVNGIYKTYTTYQYFDISYYISGSGTYSVYVIATKDGYTESTSNTAYYTYYPTLDAPELYIDTDSIADVRITNNNSVEVTCYYGSYEGSTDYSITISANDNTWANSGISFDETYYFYFEASGYNASSSNSIYVSDPDTPDNPPIGDDSIQAPAVASAGYGGYAEIANPNGYYVELYVDGAYYGDMSAYDYQTLYVGSGYISFRFYGNGEWSDTEYASID